MLTESCRPAFAAGDRYRGESRVTLDRIDLSLVGQQGAMAIASGSRDEDYVVAVDFSELHDGQLGIHCDCPRFQQGDNCKHVWGTLCKLDQEYQIPVSSSRSLEIFEVDASTLEVGRARAKKQPHQRRSRAADRLQTSKPVRSAVSAWKQTLQSIAEGSTSTTTVAQAEIPTAAFEQARWQQQHWFVLSLANEANDHSLRVDVMRSSRKRNGQWSRPVPCSVSAARLRTSVDQKERAVLSLLKPADDFSSYLYDRASVSSTFEADPELIDEALDALQATGRFAWKLSGSRYFDDATPIDAVDRAGEPWRLCVTVAPSKAKETQLSVSAVLRRDQEQIPISSVMLASDVGYSLVQCPDARTAVPAAEDLVPQENLVQHNERTGGQSDGQHGGLLAELSVEALGAAESADETRIQTKIIRICGSDAPAVRAWQKVGNVSVPRRSINTLLDQLVGTHASHDVVIDLGLGIAEATAVPMGRCLLSKPHGANSFDASLFVRYDDEDVPFDAAINWWWKRKEKLIVHRSSKAESRLLESIPVEAFRVAQADGLSDSREQLKVDREDFIAVVEKMQAAGWEVLAENSPVRIASDFNIEVTSGVDWFDVYADADFDGVTASLPQLLAALRSGNKTILLDDGTCGMLPEAWLQRVAGLEASGETTDDAIRFGRAQALLLDTMLAEQDDVRGDHSFSELCTKLRSFEGIAPKDAPDSFTGKLREYQRLALGWFDFLQEYRFGGCLADDMGLGKTIQVLALLEQRRSRTIAEDGTRKPSIAVVPKSLIFNWIDEARHFTPQLNVLNYTGSDRDERFSAARDNADTPLDLILTTYGTLRRDAARLRELEFDYVILDEAQAIKNPGSLSAKACRLLRGDHRLAMTGTPVENHLGDLWSLFDFLNPGMLGKAPRAASLSDDEDRRRIQQVAQSLRPFILRRTKAQVLTELPEKVEQTLSCEMNSQQRKLYHQLKEHYRIHISKKVEELGLKRSKIHVLEALLRLRQAACDPRLVNPDSQVSGAKLENLLQQLEEIISEGHKALVFSQFTQLLGMVRQEIDERGWQYEYLDGKTNKRAQHVKRFQEDDACQLFLISLKAGGNGLNLTAADYVFILDPWWNPAVEAQAIDRAHRMGQTKSVMAYRMICSDTVEEKIIQLQQSKRDLADAIISQDKSLISELTADDLQQLLS